MKKITKPQASSPLQSDPAHSENSPLVSDRGKTLRQACKELEQIGTELNALKITLHEQGQEVIALQKKYYLVRDQLGELSKTSPPGRKSKRLSSKRLFRKFGDEARSLAATKEPLGPDFSPETVEKIDHIEVWRINETPNGLVQFSAFADTGMYLCSRYILMPDAGYYDPAECSPIQKQADSGD